MAKGVAFIPARSGSERIKNKNIKFLNGHPLLAYSIVAAKKSGEFEDVICATDDETYADIAKHYGALVPCMRPKSTAESTSADISWVDYMLNAPSLSDKSYDFFGILRPTNPFRSISSIKLAANLLLKSPWADSIRAVEKCGQHPGKMWIIKHDMMVPLFPFDIEGTPWHSNQYAALPEIYAQNASLELAWVNTALTKKSISGDKILPLKTNGYEGFDINTPLDWFIAEKLLEEGLVTLPEIEIIPVA